MFQIGVGKMALFADDCSPSTASANNVMTSTHQFEKVPKTENNENMIQKLRKQQCIVDCSILSPSLMWLSHAK